MKIILSKEKLYQYYIEENKSSGEISKIFNCSQNTILRNLERYGIPKRKFTFNHSKKSTKKIIDKDLLEQLYIKEGKSMREVAKIFRISIDTVWHRLKEYGFKLRHLGSTGNEARINKEDLYRLYVIELKTLKEIGNIYEVSSSTIKNFMNKYDLGNYTKEYRPNFKIRGDNHPTKRPEVREKMSKPHPSMQGKNNPHFGKLASHGKKINYKNIWMRSTWEVAYAKYLDKNNIKWLYESKTFDLGEMTYTPDFYLPKTDTYIEIKGYWRDNARIKFDLFKIKYDNIKLKLLEEFKLKQLGVL